MACLAEFTRKARGYSRQSLRNSDSLWAQPAAGWVAEVSQANSGSQLLIGQQYQTGTHKDGLQETSLQATGTRLQAALTGRFIRVASCWLFGPECSKEQPPDSSDNAPWPFKLTVLPLTGIHTIIKLRIQKNTDTKMWRNFFQTEHKRIQMI